MSVRDDYEPLAPAIPSIDSSGQPRRRGHSPFIVNGRPADLQPLPTIDPLAWDSKPIPERRWIVPGLIPEGNVTMLNGDGGLGKSQLALQLLVACTLGKGWIGNDVRRCKAIGLFCEDDRDELHRRLADIVRHYGASFADLEDLKLVCRVDQENLLLEFRDQWSAGETTALYQRLQTLVAEHGSEFLVVDSLHDLFGGNENSRSHARQFIGGLRSIALGMDGAVLLTAHPSLSGRNSGTGEAGSTAWNNAVRSRLYLTAPQRNSDNDADADYRELKTMKANYGSAGGLMRLRWQEGVFVRDEPDYGIIGSIKRRAAEDTFLDLLDTITRQGRHVSDTRNSPRYAPKIFADMPGADGTRKAEFERAMAALFHAGKIVVGSHIGADRHRVKAIVRSAGSAGSGVVSD
jgi:RecA-family ATPase